MNTSYVILIFLPVQLLYFNLVFLLSIGQCY